MANLRRLDHVAIAVRQTETALDYFTGHLGLEVVHTQQLDSPHVRLTYLDAGNAFIQLVEPLDARGELARWLDERGEGLHHICFAVDDVLSTVHELAPESPPPKTAVARGRTTAFVPGPPMHGVTLECTALQPDAAGTAFDAKSD